ncbi:MAG TPA: PAS domain S-box protein [Waterburya sp.]
MQDFITPCQQTQAALRQSEARFQRIAASVPGVIYQFLWHLDGSVACPFISPMCREIFEVEAVEVEADASLLTSMIHPQDVEHFNHSMALSIETLERWQWEGRFILPSGRLIWIQVASLPERQANGDILWDGLLMDITARKQIEEALRQAREELELRVEERTAELRQANERLRFTQFSVDHAAEAIFWMDANARFFYVNEAACQLLGYSREELLAMRVHEVDPNFPAESGSEHWKQLKSQGALTRESTSRAKDGRIFPIELSINYLEFNGQEYNCVFVRDISKRKKAEAERDRTQRFLNSLLENLPLAVFVKEAEQLRFVFWNKMSTQLIGYSSQQVLGKTGYELFPTQAADFFVAEDREVLASGQLLDIPEELIHIPHRGQRILHTKKIPLFDEAGKPQYLLGITEDITERKQTEMALRQSQERLQTVMTAAPLILFALDARGIFTLSEGKGLEAIGRKPGEIVGLSIYEVYRDKPELIEHFHRALAGEPVENIVVNFAGIVFDNRYSVIRDETGKILGITGIALDITERYKAKEALQQSEQKFRSIVENANDIIYQLTPDAVFSYVSPNWVDILGHDVAEVEGQLFTPFIHPDDLAICLGTLHRAIETGQKQSGIEYRVRHKNGSWRWHTSNISILRDASGTVVSVVGIARDISDRKQAEEALRESEERFRNLVESTNDLIWEIDEEAIYTYVSPQIKDILGYEVEEVLGKTPFNFMPPEEADRIREVTSNRVAWRLPLTNLENTNLHKDGHLVVLETSGVPFFDKAGHFQGYRGIDRDITKRKQTEEAIRQSKAQLQQQATQLEQTLRQLQDTQTQLIQTEKMSSLGQLVGGVAHEINNPINFIYGNINHARNYAFDFLKVIQLYQATYPHPSPQIQLEIEKIDLDFVSEDFLKILDSMEVGAQRIRGIVESLRNFSRFDEANVKEVDIHQGLDSTLMLLQSRLTQRLRPSTIQVIKEYGTLPLVECYPGYLNQVFMNLLTNAIDALEEAHKKRNSFDSQTPPGMIRICTGISHESALNPQAVICIADNGTGMTEEVRSRAFDPFFTTKPVGEGTGLGLAVSYQIVVKLHKGQLSCYSSPDEGSEFVIQIPIQQSSI